MTAVFGAPPDPGTKPVYPFAEWLNGQQWILIRGRDYWGDPGQLTRSLEASARARRLRVVVTGDGSGNLYVRAYPGGADAQTNSS